MTNIKIINDKIFRLLFTFFVLFVIGTTNLFSAEPANTAKKNLPGEASTMQDKKSNEINETVISNDKVKTFLKGIEFYGSIAKPQTVFIIPGTDPRVDGLKINRHFFSHIFRPVEKSTLRRVRIKQGNNKDHILW